MDGARYLIALLLVISTPPGFFLWFLIHPFARQWRRIGALWTYVVLAPPSILMMVAVFHARRSILAIEFGTNYVLVAISVLALAGAMLIARARKRYLTYGVLAGLPELSPQRYPGKLLTEGIYGRIRHPRYVEVLLGILGYALFANYLAGYVLFVLSLPALYQIVLLEERELRERFGAEYVEYERRVPRFVPW
ncbi:MAG: methyltransferase [Acidobacteriota bacterium]